jgi:phage terminase large subunit-like protein
VSALAEAAYAKLSEGAFFAEWCEANLQHSVDRFAGTPVVWEPWQREFFEELLSVDENHSPYWSSAGLVVSRKNGKTAMLAALALYRLLEDDGQPEILLAAASDKQAGRLFDAVVSYLRRNPELDSRVQRREYVGEIVNIETGGKIIRLPSSGETLDGFNPSLAICDELHAWNTPTRRRVWSSLNTGGAARARTQVVTITTAGDALARETSILGRLIDTNERDGEVDRPDEGLTISRNHGARTLIYNYSAPTKDPSDVPAMKLANPASWVSEEFLAKQAASPELTTAEVLQLHGCVWAQSLASWIPDEAWHGCLDKETEIPRGGEIVAGVDVGLHHDHSAVVFAWKSPSGRVVMRARVWEPQNEADGRTRVTDVEDHLRDLASRYKLVAVVYDERFFNRSAEILSDEGLDMHELIQSSSQMADAYQGFYQAAIERRLSHDGGVLSRHVLGCSAEMTERGWKVKKLRQSQKIDAAVAAVMAVWGVENIAAKPKYRTASWA